MISDDIKKMFGTLPDKTTLLYGHGDAETDENEKAIAIFSFCEKDFGVGEITIVSYGGRTFIDAETMSKEHIKRILGRLVDSAILDTDEDPENKALYNQATGRKTI